MGAAGPNDHRQLGGRRAVGRTRAKLLDMSHDFIRGDGAVVVGVRDSATYPIARRGQQFDRVDVDGGGESFDGLQAEVAFTAFESADIRAVIPEDISEGFLGQAESSAVRGQVPADNTLQISFGHTPILNARYLTLYRLISSVRLCGDGVPETANAARACGTGRRARSRSVLCRVLLY